jgi:hypothetical protein
MSSRLLTRQRLTLIGVFALFFVPVLTAYILRLNPEFIGDFSTSNRGELIQPPRALEPGLLTLVQYTEATPLSFKAHWTVLSFVLNACDADCEAHLHALHNAHIATHKDKARVQRVLVLPSDGRVPDVVGRIPELLVVRASPETLSAITGSAKINSSTGVHLVDPRGFVFMRYAPDQSAADVLKDLKQLLKISKVG